MLVVFFSIIFFSLFTIGLIHINANISWFTFFSFNYSSISHAKPVNVDIGHHIEDMICDLGQHDFEQAHAPLYDKIENDSKKGSVFGVHSFHKVVNGVSFGQFEGTIWVE